MRYYALVDCNNFYASCERAFAPRLIGQPVVVLSNNDGCVVARSEEAKALNIPMGAPVFQLKPLIQQHDVQVYSSNYALYGDMSRRVMETLASQCEDIEVYSIDEAFLQLHIRQAEDLHNWARRVRELVTRSVGIPVSVGIGRSKTLAKLANHIAKRRTKTGIYILEPADPILSTLSIDQVWGIGRAYVRRLSTVQVQTVAQLVAQHEPWMQREFGIVGLRLLKELKGMACYDLEPPVCSRQHTMVSRSFAHDLYDLPEIQRRLSLYAARLGEKLRQYQQTTQLLTVYLWVNRFRNMRRDGRSCFVQSVRLPLATHHTGQLIHQVRQVAAQLWQPGTNYKKAGILASDLQPDSVLQGSLFDAPRSTDRTVMATIDRINQRMGERVVFFAACGQRPSIPLRQEHRSDRYTTRWQEILRVQG